MRKKVPRFLFFLFAFGVIGLNSSESYGTRFNVLVVMSYEERFPWDEHIREGIESVLGDIAMIKYFYMDTKSNIAGGEQKAKEAYPAKYVDFKMPKTFEELTQMVEELKGKSDALLMLTVKGIPKEDGSILDDKDGIPIVGRLFGKPLIGVSEFQAKYGVLCAVINTGQEQGGTSARMLLKAMQGTPVSQIPITRNMHGKRMINVTTMKALGIEPRPIILKGAELVRTEE
jgi:hypothetical protein